MATEPTSTLRANHDGWKIAGMRFDCTVAHAYISVAQLLRNFLFIEAHCSVGRTINFLVQHKLKLHAAVRLCVVTYSNGCACSIARSFLYDFYINS